MKNVIAFSGGVDSTTVLAGLKGDDNTCVFINYGSRHNKYEFLCGGNLCHHYGSYFYSYNIDKVFNGNKSSLLIGGEPIPEGHYEDEKMKSTVLPGRNTLINSILFCIAETIGAKNIYVGYHKGDAKIYPDCRPEYIKSYNDMLSTISDIKLNAPLIEYSKADVVKLGLELDAPYHMTRTCYKNQLLACGKCGSCNERLEAFKLNGIEDVIKYEE